ncbi:MAG: NACHT domain-containing protein [Caldilineaceae bacterium]
MAQEPSSSSDQPNTSGNYDQRGQTVVGLQLNVTGDVYGDIVLPRLDLADIRNQRYHTILRQSVRRFWIEGVLKSSLCNEILLRLDLEDRSATVDSRPWNLILQHANQPEWAIPADKEIVGIFDEMGQQMLILGESGSGKTTTLLTLANALLVRTESDPALQTPVVFNLSSWTEKQLPLNIWLADELNSRYKIPRKIAQGWIENDELLFLLDGLDEVTENKRNACVTAINNFRREHVVGLVVCSRTAEYETLAASGKKLDLVGAVAIQPLSEEQINKYLEMADPSSRLRNSIAENIELRRLAEIPFMLNIMVLAYQKQVHIGSVSNRAGRTELENLFDTYIQRALEHREQDHTYSPIQILRMLSFLSNQMRTLNTSVFYIDNVVPTWLNRGSQFRVFQLIVGLITGLTVGFGMWLLGSISKDIAIAVGIMVGVQSFARLRGALEVADDQSRIRLNQEKMYYMRKKELINNQLIVGVTVVFSSGLSLWLVGGLDAAESFLISFIFNMPSILIMSGGPEIAEQQYRDDLKMEQVQPIEPSTNISLTVDLILNLFVGLVSGGMAGMLAGWIALSRIRIFNQLATESLSIVLPTVLTTMLIVGVIRGYIYMWIFRLVLRFLLYMYGRVPWNYAHFLDYATSRILLHRVGDGYIFIHRMIMEHMARLTDKDIERIIVSSQN